MRSEFSEYVTKLVGAWLENAESYYNRYMEKAAADLDAANGNKETAADMLAEEIREDLTEESPAGSVGLYADLISAALSECDFVDVATGFLDK